MPLVIFYYGVILFLAAFILHVLIWRYAKASKEMFLLFLLFLVFPGIAISVGVILHYFGGKEIAAIALLHYSLAIAYIQTYPGLRDDIPSFRILMLLDRAGGEGMSESELLNGIGEASLFAFKVSELESDRLVIGDGDRIRLSTAGRILATVFIGYRRLLGLELGKG